MFKKNTLKKNSYYNISSYYVLLYLFLIIAFGINKNCYGQIVNDLPRGAQQSSTKKDSSAMKQDSVVIAVKLKAVSFNLENIFDTIPFKDSILTADFPYFNDLDRFDFPVLDNGYIGSSSRPLAGFGYNTGFKLGLNQYDLYNIDTRYFHISNVPLTTLYFSPGSEPSEFTTRARFSKNFKDVSLNINYARINNIGKYKDQNNKHTNLDVGLWKGNLESRFNTFFNFMVSVNEEHHNGGISNENLLYEGAYLYRQNVPVNLSEAVSRYDNYRLSLTEYYELHRNSKRYFGFSPYLIGEIEYSKGFYKFYDKNVSGDDVVYKSYIVDEIGLRNYTGFNHISTDFSLFGVKKSSNYIKIGFNYKRIKYTHEPLATNSANQVYVYSRSSIGILNNVLLNWNTKFHFGDFRGEYDLKFGAKYKNRYFTIGGSINRGVYSASFYNNNLWLSHRKVYVNSFKKIKDSEISGILSVDKLGFSAAINAHLINNYIFYDDSLMARQMTGNLSYASLNIKENIKLWIFHLDNSVYLFNSSSRNKPLPKYTLKSKFYITPKLFKKRLRLNTGFEFNYWDKFHNYGYNPVLANYFVQQNTKLDNYRRLDFFLSAKIDQFLFFVRINHILFYADHFVPFKVISYPQNDMFYRIGVQWTLVQ